MTYEHIVAGTFVSWLNRFVAHVGTGNRVVVYHVESTGRCRELLIPGAAVILESHPDVTVSGGKTKHDLTDVCRSNLFINMDFQTPDKATWEWLTSLDGSIDGYSCTEKAGFPFSPLGPYIPYDMRRKVTHGDSRSDLTFSLGDRNAKAVSPALMEVKDVTLEENDMAVLLDTSTERDIEHLEGSIRAHEEGYKAYVLFVVQMESIHSFTPDDITHPTFGGTLRQAREAGVHVPVYDCLVTPDTMIVDPSVKAILD